MVKVALENIKTEKKARSHNEEIKLAAIQAIPKFIEMSSKIKALLTGTPRSPGCPGRPDGPGAPTIPCGPPRPSGPAAPTSPLKKNMSKDQI